MRNIYFILTILFFLPVNFFCTSLPTVDYLSPMYPAGFYGDDALPDKTVYLTFDDGPSEWTEEILNILKREKIKGTFFISANWIPHSTRENNSFKKFRSTLIRMIKDGNSVGNHTFDHKDLAVLTPEKIAAELDENQELLDKELGKQSVNLTLFRPPFGSPWFYNYPKAEILKVSNVIRTRAVPIMWCKNYDSGDSKNWVKGDWYRETSRINSENAEFKKRMSWIYDRATMVNNDKGVVVLFHDTHLTTVKILPVVIEKYKSAGYKFETIEEFVKWKWKKGSADIIINSK